MKWPGPGPLIAEYVAAQDALQGVDQRGASSNRDTAKANSGKYPRDPQHKHDPGLDLSPVSPHSLDGAHSYAALSR
jgi:hypothetical protein